MAEQALTLLGTDREKGFLLDPYLDWVAAEGPPLHEGISVDLLTAETAVWPRFDCRAAFVHLTGRGDYCAAYGLDIPPGKATAQVKHLYECFVYVLEGYGSTKLELPDGRTHSFEWQPRSLFALPLNMRYRMFNSSGAERALLACTHFLPFMMNLFHQERFIFDNAGTFGERIADPKYLEGEGRFTPIAPGRHSWDTTFVPDLSHFDLPEWKERGAGGSSIGFILADGALHAHSSEIPAARYKKGHRHNAGVHIWAVTGSGYTMLWYDGQEMIEVPWRHGVVYAPPFMMFHQHFNTSPRPARYLAVGMGSRRYPLFAIKRESSGGKVDTDIKKGGNQIEYRDQDPRLHARWLKEIEKNGVASDMDAFIG